MIKIDLITGFLGSGKTTFIKNYVQYLKNNGNKVGIIENDFGSVNVDRMLLTSLEDDNCIVEQIVGGNIIEDYKRRFKTKLIALKMQGVSYVLVEPSGIYNTDLFFDVLEDDTLSSWFNINSIICLVTVYPEFKLTKEMEYLLVNQLSSSGIILFSHCDKISDLKLISDRINEMNNLLANYHSPNEIKNFIAKDFNKYDNQDYLKVINGGYNFNKIDYLNINLNNIFQNVFLYNLNLNKDYLIDKIKKAFINSDLGKIIRIKGYILDNIHYLEINATNKETNINSSLNGQNVLIIIGQNLDEEKIKQYFN